MRKRKHQEEHENLERWLVSYADFITLLFAFFTVMYALSLVDKTHYRATLENIQRSFLSSGGVFPLRGTPFHPFENPHEKGAETPPSDDNLGKQQPSYVAEKKLNEQIQSLFKDTTGLGVPKGAVQVARTEEGYKVRLGEQLLFSPGSDKLKRESIAFLYELGKRLKRLDLPVQIEGHSDNTHFPNQTNWQLSIARAYNVVQFLVEGAAFPQDKISLSGYGDTRPVASNKTADGRARNRRVEISILTPNHEPLDRLW